MEQQIEKLIGAGRLEEALDLLKQVDKQAALLLQAQYNEGRRQLDDGVIEPKEWRRISARLANSVLKTLQKIKPAKPEESTGIDAANKTADIAQTWPDTLEVSVKAYIERKINSHPTTVQ